MLAPCHERGLPGWGRYSRASAYQVPQVPRFKGTVLLANIELEEAISNLKSQVVVHQDKVSDFGVVFV